MAEERITVKDALKILGVSGLVISSILLPNIAISYNYLGKQWRKYKRGDIGRIVKRLHEQELLSVSEEDGKTVIKLSDKGKQRLLKYDFDNISLPKHRDGKFRVVSFDIPNDKRVARDIFRRKLKDLGFLQVQESIFITPYPCREQIEFIINLLEISEFVMLFQLGKIEFGPKFLFKKYK